MVTCEKKKILVLEPYWGGSHKQFLEGLVAHVDANYHFMTLPARKWKMRMQLAAPYYRECIQKLPKAERHFDGVLCSTFIDVAVLKALLPTIVGWNPAAKVYTYFHENQFAYPNASYAPENFQFAAINFSTALASDSIAFNSEFNRRSFLQGIDRYLQAAKDMKLVGITEAIYQRSCVLYPGIDFATIDRQTRRGEQGEVPVIVWNHRWEHDKNPEEFFAALSQVKKRGIPFKLVVLGENFRNRPACFDVAREEFHDEILHFGFAKDYADYCAWLHRADIAVSTAIHEFYGIAVIEAVRAGCRPLLPKRLSYPELFDAQYLYEDGALAESLMEILGQVSREGEKGKMMTEGFSWKSLAASYGEWLEV